ncbi:MAG: LysM repeat protein [Verrucomicrobiales bacterium]
MLIMLKQFASPGLLLFVTLVGSSFGSSQVSSSQLSKVRGHKMVQFQAPISLVAVGGIHTVRNGETLWGIARKCGVSFDELVRLNGLSIKNPNIKIGTHLKLPGGVKVAAPRNAPAKGVNHLVQAGETLSQISRRYRVSAKAIQTANNMANPNSLRVGQPLLIPGVGSQQQRPPAATAPRRKDPPSRKVVVAPPANRSVSVPLGFALYQTESSDSMNSIAKKYRISKAELLRINRRSSTPNYSPRLGELVMVPTDGSWYVPNSKAGTRSPAQPQGKRLTPQTGANILIEHPVAPNDTLEALSRRFGTTIDQIRLDNPGIRRNSDLRVGSGLKIRVKRSL